MGKLRMSSESPEGTFKNQDLCVLGREHTATQLWMKIPKEKSFIILFILFIGSHYTIRTINLF